MRMSASLLGVLVFQLSVGASEGLASGAIQGFDGRVEPQPDLKVTGRRLDGAETLVHPVPATNARHVDFGGWTILTGIDVPVPGCWELTGTYRGQSVSFVVWITA